MTDKQAETRSDYYYFLVRVADIMKAYSQFIMLLAASALAVRIKGPELRENSTPVGLGLKFLLAMFMVSLIQLPYSMLVHKKVS